MPNRGTYWNWDEDKERLFALAKEPDTRNWTHLAKKFGRARTTIVSAAQTHGWTEDLEALFANTEAPLEVKGIPPHDVLSPEGRQAFGHESENKFLKKEVKRLQAAVYEQEAAFDRFVSASREPRRDPGFKFRRHCSGPKKRDIILHMSDWHYGQLVHPESVAGGVNVFNREVFEKRLNKYVNSVCAEIEDYSASHTYENLVFCMGGDMIEGLGVFEGQEWHLWEDPFEQVVNSCELYASAMDEIMGVATTCGARNVSVLCIPGNHGKPGGKRGGATPSTYSFDWLLYKLLQKELSRYPFFNFVIEPAGECYFLSQDHTFSLHHGDELRGWGGLPFYGIARHDAKTIRANQLINDYALLGHHHQQAEIPLGYGVTYISGNAVGPNNLKRFVGSGPAMQRLFFTSDEHGVGWPIPIYLQERHERLVTPTIHAVG